MTILHSTIQLHSSISEDTICMFMCVLLWALNSPVNSYRYDSFFPCSKVLHISYLFLLMKHIFCLMSWSSLWILLLYLKGWPLPYSQKLVLLIVDIQQDLSQCLTPSRSSKYINWSKKKKNSCWNPHYKQTYKHQYEPKSIFSYLTWVYLLTHYTNQGSKSCHTHSFIY